MIEVQRLSISEGTRRFTDTCGGWLLRRWHEEQGEFCKELANQRRNFSIYVGDFDDPYRPRPVFAGENTLLSRTMGSDWRESPASQATRPCTPSGQLRGSKSLSIGYYESKKNREPQCHLVCADVFVDGAGLHRTEYVRLILPFFTPAGVCMPLMYTHLVNMTSLSRLN